MKLLNRLDKVTSLYRLKEWEIDHISPQAFEDQDMI